MFHTPVTPDKPPLVFGILAVAACALAAMADAAPAVESVDWSVRGNAHVTLVDVSFSFVHTQPDTPCHIALFGHDATNRRHYPMTTFLEGDISHRAFRPGNHNLTWVLSADTEDRIDTEQFVLYVRVSDAGPVAPGRYLVIDVSGGPEASRYPAVYVSSHNVDVLQDVYKRDRIVLRALPDGSFMGVYPVTQAQYERVTGETPSGFPEHPMRPVEQVSWNIITDRGAYDSGFIALLREKTGIDTLDLPSAEGWEYACRAGTTMAFNDYTQNRGKGADLQGSWDEPDDTLDILGWYWGNSGMQTHDVGGKQANAWGLYDMHGNVWEWTTSRSADNRLVSGGSWYYYAEYCRSGRVLIPAPEYNNSYYGFRLAVPAEDSAATAPDFDQGVSAPDLLHGEPFRDYNGNGTPDALEDWNGSGMPDAFEDRVNGIPRAFLDTNASGFPDGFEDTTGSGVPDWFKDSDGDGVPDRFDNCPEVHNPGQRDTNNNGVGDLCDTAAAPPVFSSSHPDPETHYFDSLFRAHWDVLALQFAEARGFLYVIDQAPQTIITPLEAAYTTETRLRHEVPGPGDWRLHLAAVDDSGVIIEPSRTRLPFRTGALYISSETHPEPHQASLLKDFEGLVNAEWYAPGTRSFSIAGRRHLLDDAPDTIPTPDNATWTDGVSPVIQYQGLAPGAYWLHVVAEDFLGNVSPPAHFGFEVGNAPCEVESPSHPDPKRAYYARDARFSWTAGGVPDVVRYYVEFDTDPDTVPTVESKAVTESTLTFTDLAPGTYWFHVRSEDRHGYLSPPAHRRIEVSAVAAAPVVSSPSHPDKDRAYRHDTVQFTWDDPDGFSAAYYYVFDQSPETVPTAEHARTTHRECNFYRVNDGTYYFHVRGVDGQGHLSETGRLRVTVKQDAPVVHDMETPEAPDPREDAPDTPGRRIETPPRPAPPPGYESAAMLRPYAASPHAAAIDAGLRALHEHDRFHLPSWQNYALLDFLRRRFGLAPQYAIKHNYVPERHYAHDHEMALVMGRLVDPDYRVNKALLDLPDDHIARLMAQAVYCDQHPPDEDYLDNLMDVFNAQESLEGIPGYMLTHVILCCQWLRELRCDKDFPEIDALWETFADTLEEIVEQGGASTDLAFEAMAMLQYIGEGGRCRPEWMDTMLSLQQPNGAWAYEPGGPPDGHPTALAVWTLLEDALTPKEPWLKR